MWGVVGVRMVGREGIRIKSTLKTFDSKVNCCHQFLTQKYIDTTLWFHQNKKQRSYINYEQYLKFKFYYFNSANTSNAEKPSQKILAQVFWQR